MIPALLLALTPYLAQSTGPPPGEPVTVLARERVHTIPGAFVRTGHLWIPVSALARLTGFRLKPEGFCAEELCIPQPTTTNAPSWTERRADQSFVDLTAFSEHVGQASVHSRDDSVWSLAPVPLLTSPLLEGLAPDFELLDREGNAVRLSDLRGSKVLLLSWASW